jgi:hypothetical protein
MIRLCSGLGAFLLAVALFAAPIHAQAVRPGAFGYDASKEVTLNATVETVVTKPSPGTLMGPHLVLQTSSGRVQASLGRYALRGKDAIPLASGQRIQVTGVMTSVGNSPIFLARTIQVEGRIYTIRNANGFVVPPVHDQSATTPAKGGSL